MSHVHRGMNSNLGRLMKKSFSAVPTAGAAAACNGLPGCWAQWGGGRQHGQPHGCKELVIPGDPPFLNQVQSRCETCNCLVPDLVFDEHRQTCWAKSDTKRVFFAFFSLNRQLPFHRGWQPRWKTGRGNMGRMRPDSPLCQRSDLCAIQED